MVTTLSILSLDQGKIAPHYDIEPMSPEETAEAALSKSHSTNRNASGSGLAGIATYLVVALSQLKNGLALAMPYRRFDPEYLREVSARINPTVPLTPASLKFRTRVLP